MTYRFFALAAFLAAVGAACAAYGDGPQSLLLEELGAGDRLEVRTADYRFRFDMVEPVTGEALVALSRDGVHFGPADRVFLLGATRGRHAEGPMFVHMGRVEVGKRIELAVRTFEPQNRRITGPVESMAVTLMDPTASP